MRPPKDIERFAKDASVKTSEAANEQILQRMRDAYEDSARAPVEGRAGGWIAASRGRIVELAVAAMIFVAIGALFDHLVKPLGANVVWADVTQRFQTVPFFSATMYMKDDATSEPTQMELWMSQDGRIRLRIGTQVVFARGGAATKAYDIKSRQPVEPDERARVFIGKINEAGELSLDAIIKVMFGGRSTEVTPLVNPDAVISQDMVVFDVEMPDTPEWVRIWALRESRLPVRITVWDPRDGRSTDAVLSYSKQQPDEFFDPNAFESLLQSDSGASRVNIAYAFLTDPGGKDITPEEMFAGSGYHMPVVEQVGITPDGAVWVIAAKGRNRMPNGYSFFGFGKLEDDLGRSYRCVSYSHRTATDQSMEVYTPADYPFDHRAPAKLSLTCWVEHNPYGVPVTVGTLELTQWQQGRLWPEGTIRDSEHEIMLREAVRYCENEELDKCRRIIDTVQAGVEHSRLEHTVTKLKLKVLIRQHTYEEAARFALALWPAEMQKYLHPEYWWEPYEFVDIIVAVAAAGQTDKAHDLWQQVKAAQPDLSHWEKYAADDFHRKLPDAIRRAQSGIVRELARIALPDDKIGRVIDCNVTADENYGRLIAMGKSQEAQAAARRAAEQRLRELAEYYESHPLPDRAELLERPDGRDIVLAGTGNALPRHEGYKVLPINASISAIVSILKDIGADESEATKVHPYQSAIRFVDGLQDRELRADLVYRDGIPLGECFHLVLASFGVEVTYETRPAQTISIASHDGRKLRNHMEVYAPWHAGSGRSGGRVWHVAKLLEQLSQQMQGSVFILDETGVEEPLCIGDGNPQWQGAGGVEQARRWLQEQFGITMAEETRTITTYLIQRRTR